MRSGQVLPDPPEQVDKRRLRAKEYGDDSRLSLEHVWAFMGLPCGKYFVVMREMWLPLLGTAGDLNKEFATAEGKFPSRLLVFDSDKGWELINRDVTN
jgi:hypothetical protein